MAGGIPRRGSNGEWYAEDLEALQQRVEDLEERFDELEQSEAGGMTGPEEREMQGLMLQLLRGMALSPAPTPRPGATSPAADADKVNK